MTFNTLLKLRNWVERSSFTWLSSGSVRLQDETELSHFISWRNHLEKAHQDKILHQFWLAIFDYVCQSHVITMLSFVIWERCVYFFKDKFLEKYSMNMYCRLDYLIKKKVIATNKTWFKLRLFPAIDTKRF